MKNLTLIFALIFATTVTFANNNNNNKNAADSTASKSMDKETIYDKTPIFDKTACKLDLKFEIKTDGLTTTFENQSEGKFTNVEWTFGDGFTTDNANGSHTYDKEGEYYFTVTVYNAETGCVDFFSDKHTVSKVEATNVNTLAKK